MRLTAEPDYSYRAYDVFRLEDGAWVWCGYGNGRAMLPKYVRERLAEGRPAECVVEGYRYCIKPPSRGQNRSDCYTVRDWFAWLLLTATLAFMIVSGRRAPH
jgi:hypothetical protein